MCITRINQDSSFDLELVLKEHYCTIESSERDGILSIKELANGSGSARLIFFIDQSNGWKESKRTLLNCINSYFYIKKKIQLIEARKSRR